MEPHAAGGVIAIFMMLMIPVLVITTFILFIISLIQILKNKFETNNDKTIWLIIIIFTGPLGQVLYWTIGRNKIVKEEKPIKTIKDTKKRCNQCNSEMTIREKQNNEGTKEAFWVCNKYSEGCKTFEKT